jgi:mono/diheme cytochrome c family protein
MRSHTRVLLPIALALLVLPAASEAQDELPPAAGRAVAFDRDIRPILAARCLSCHDAEHRKGGFRLDRRESLLTGGDSGPAVEVGKSAESVLIEKVAGLDPVSTMPPKGHRLTSDEVGLLRAWIDQGARWEGGPLVAESGSGSSDHWAFRKPVRPTLPEVRDRSWPRNPIDRFILARLEAEGLSPSPEAGRATLIRRLSLDLTGLPPPPEEVAAFVADGGPGAYERLVDRLLDSPHYGERWARRWLDLARYADTNGYEKDRPRSIWPYRDWIIQALNADMPFDRFTVEQLAGDLLPNPTLSQRVATGFHRNTMINEEGGIDVEEYRFAATVDRVATTGTVWLGLTIGCAQCHSHKFDPITQREYYQFYAFLNNADEPELALPDPILAARRAEILAKIVELEADLDNEFPLPEPSGDWNPLKPASAESSGGATLTTQPDGSILASGEAPEVDRYTLTLDLNDQPIDALRLEALSGKDASGPGRTPHGNFVVTSFRVFRAAKDDAGEPVPVPIEGATADFSQRDFDPAGALDDDPKTGWAIDDGSGDLKQDRAAVFRLKEPIAPCEGTRLIVVVEQAYGGTHTLRQLRLAGRSPRPEIDPPLPIAERRRRHLEASQAAWEKAIRPVRWNPVAPTKVTSRKHATMTVLDDRSVLATGDKPNNDVYELELPIETPGLTAVRIEALPHESLPDGGPGRAPLFSVGDFILTEIEAGLVDPDRPEEVRPLKFAGASEDYAEAGHPAELALDGQPDTGWTVKGRTGQPHAAVFTLAEPVGDVGRSALRLTLHQFGIHQMTLGRFRVSVTTDPLPVDASGVPAGIEEILLVPAGRRTEEQSQELRRYYLSIAPELAGPRRAIAALRRSLPEFPTTMVMQERPPEHARTTHIHRRGEYLKPTETVEPGVPAVLPPLTEEGPRNRLALARWLVDEENPLAARVAMNRAWAAFFGRGIVATLEDFGTRGEKATHPELLDWLAVEFMERDWSVKAMHRLIVTSATYRQGARVTPSSLESDPRNLLLARGPRLRVDAEVVRDIALAASGLLDRRIGGPSVYPPQPAGATALAYGMTPWPTSQGASRYRRGLYTSLKRTAPYAPFVTFDAPTSETTCPRRERSNTPLQALTLLNDTVFTEAAQALARRAVEEAGPGPAARIGRIFELCLSRTPTDEELASVLAFRDDQLARFRSGDLDASKVAGVRGAGSAGGCDVADLAALTAVARAILNLDETITKE